MVFHKVERIEYLDLSSKQIQLVLVQRYIINAKSNFIMKKKLFLQQIDHIDEAISRPTAIYP